MFGVLLGTAASENSEHSSPFHRGCPFDNGDVGDAGSDIVDTGSGDLWVRRLTTAKPHLDLDFMAVLQESTRCSNTDLEIVLVGPRPKPDLFDQRQVLVLLDVTSSFVLLEAELPQILDAAHRWRGGAGHFDQVETGLLSAPHGVVDGHDAQLLAILADDADLCCRDLTVGSRAGWYWWSGIE